jgi:hypothetical protein
MNTARPFSTLIISSLLVAGAFAQGITLAQATQSSESESLSPTPTTTPTPSPIPTQAPQDEPTFPACQELLQNPGTHASWPQGWHQIVGGPLLFGSDDVYSLESGNYVQCFCPEEGSEGIQTNWWRTLAEIQGWFVENGLQWNLGDYRYLAQNSDFDCDGGSTTPTPTPSPSPTPIPGPTPTQSPAPTPTNTPSTDSGIGGASVNSSETPNEVAGAIELAFTGSSASESLRFILGLTLSAGSWVISRRVR